MSLFESAAVGQEFDALAGREGVMETAIGTDAVSQIGVGLADLFFAEEAPVVKGGQVNTTQIVITSKKMDQKVG